MPRIARELDDAFKAVALARMFLHAAEPAASDLDLQLWKLLKKGSSILRAEVAEQLAPLVNGPPRTLRALAHDPDPEVAGPVLQYSAAISNTAIAEMARCKGDKHLEAIAARRNLHEKITGILIRRGGPSVIAALGRNETAAISVEGLHHLAMRLRHHEQGAGVRKEGCNTPALDGGSPRRPPPRRGTTINERQCPECRLGDRRSLVAQAAPCGGRLRA